MKLTETQLATIIYEKESGEVTTRVIVPTSVPKDLIRAIDVTDLNTHERETVAQQYAEYQAYVKLYLSNMFNFEGWLDHSQNITATHQWRSFKLAGLK
jgi:hypothetical protein